MLPQNNINISNFLRYAQSFTNIPTQQLNQLKQKYPATDPRSLAIQRAQQMGISPAQLEQVAKQLGITQ